jgi:predicted DCC family thiol-disulfide oxidoreductase YuxK
MSDARLPESAHAAEAASTCAVGSGRGSPASAPPIVFFDGVCGLCNRFVNFLIARDRDAVFRFAPLQGETAAARLASADVCQLNTIVLLDDGGTYRKSDAVVRILRRLGAGWPIVGRALAVLPRPLRDLGYSLVARYRYTVFGKKESCRMPTATERSRFLP